MTSTPTPVPGLSPARQRRAWISTFVFGAEAVLPWLRLCRQVRSRRYSNPLPHRSAGTQYASGLAQVRPGARPGLDRRFALVRSSRGCAFWRLPSSRSNPRIKRQAQPLSMSRTCPRSGQPATPSPAPPSRLPARRPRWPPCPPPVTCWRRRPGRWPATGHHAPASTRRDTAQRQARHRRPSRRRAHLTPAGRPRRAGA